MKLIFYNLLVLLVVFALSDSAALADENRENRVKLYMADGQVRSRPVRVYVPEIEITRDMNPKLCLVRLHAKQKDTIGCRGTLYSPFEVAAHQVWVDESTGNKVTKTATLLLFDLKKVPIDFYMTGARVLPVLRWIEPMGTTSEKAREFAAVSEREVYLSNGIGAFLWTIFIVLFFLLIAYLLTKKDAEKLLGLVTMKNSMSMSLTQMALWTIATGSAVLYFGIMRLEVPEIPDNLVLLMAFAAGTSTVGHWQTYRWRRLKSEKKRSNSNCNLQKKEAKNAKNKKGSPKVLNKLQTLLMVDVDGNIKPSLAKAQILFWTMLTLILFVVKSMLEGQLWDVPTQLVALMGVSQLSFLGRNELAVREEAKKAPDVSKLGSAETKVDQAKS